MTTPARVGHSAPRSYPFVPGQFGLRRTPLSEFSPFGPSGQLTAAETAPAMASGGPNVRNSLHTALPRRAAPATITPDSRPLAAPPHSARATCAQPTPLSVPGRIEDDAGTFRAEQAGRKWEVG
jgi:hypothetical protein